MDHDPVRRWWLAGLLLPMAGAGLAAPAIDLFDLPLEELARMEVGIRAGIEKSIEVKREAVEIVESISAEDIGKLPDISIADSITRLPGLTAQRVNGRASTISIRGLSNDFSTTLLNGREQASVGQNRGVEFDQYPSELLSGVTVYKTPDAALVGPGLSGTINLETVRPLDYRERVLAANVRLEENSKGELNPGHGGRGSRMSFSYIDQFADHALGVAVSAARLDLPGQSERFEAWGYNDNVDANGDGRNVSCWGAASRRRHQARRYARASWPWSSSDPTTFIGVPWISITRGSIPKRRCASWRRGLACPVRR